MTVPPLTPFQTVGPFFHGALSFAGGGKVAGEGAGGTRIVVEGTVRDGAGALLPDVLIETWQADADGRYNHPENGQAPPGDPRFDGFGRVATGEDGRFVIETVKPGAVPGPGGRPQAPHIAVGVLGRGILTRLVTRIYFEGEPANDHDPVLQLVPAVRRHTLIARRMGEGRYRFDIAFQGEDETVFFDV